MSLHRVPTLLVCLWTLGFGPCFGNGRLADVNLDGYVDRVDLGTVVGCIRDRSADPTCERADLDADGRVRGRDLAIVARYLGAVLFDTAWPVFTPASVHFGSRGIVYLHAPDPDRIHRWSIEQQRQLAPIELAASSRHLAYSLETDTLFVAYSDGAISRIDASQPSEEIPFASLRSTPLPTA